ncbi:hypothetical protein Tco_0727831 [Tanacetum coccineum]|uniref:Uncharacterized protein n=1 Tax=Tanacetum coccineum TaxID=301880 RepID=A0ABQ4YLS4_9ASTR
MQRPPLFEANCFIYWKNRFETYVKSKDIDLWYIIAHGNYKPTIKDKDGKDVVTPYEKLDENQKKMLSKNDEAKMDSLITTHQGNKQVKDNKIDLFVQKYEEFSITDDETIDCAFSRFNTIITSLKALDESFSSRNHVRKFLRALPSKWRPKVTAIEESKDLSKLSLDELVGNLKVYEVILEKDLEIAKNKKEKYKSLALKAKQVLSDDDTSSSDSNDEEYAMAEERREDRRCFKCGDPNHFISDYPKNSSGDQKAFVVGSWSDSGDDSKKKEICLMAHSNEVLSDNLYYSSSSLDNESRENEYDKLGQISLRIINKNKHLKAKNESLKKTINELKTKLDTLEKETAVVTAVTSADVIDKGVNIDIMGYDDGTYLALQDYSIWEVIQNGNGPVSVTTDTTGQLKILPPKTAEEVVICGNDESKDAGILHESENKGSFLTEGGYGWNPRKLRMEKELKRKRSLEHWLVKPSEIQAVPPPMTGNYLPSGTDIEIDDSQYTYGPQKNQPSESESQTTDLDTCYESDSDDEHVHMTGNKAYLADFQDFNGGHVAFGGSKGYITGKGKIKTDSKGKKRKLMGKLKLSGRIIEQETENLVTQLVCQVHNERLSLSETTNSQEDDSEIPPLEDIHEDTTDGIFTHSSYDDEGAEADFTNLEIVVNFEDLKVWILVILPYGKKGYRYKVGVTENKMDESGVVIDEEAPRECTPIETQKPLVKDEEASDVDVHLYRSMIGSLMYVTASRPDIMFAVCACSRFQVTPKTSHLSAVKRIFRYLKGKPKLGLWYPRDSSFDLESYSDSDYAGANLDRKSTTGGCQFLGRRLITWQCKKQTIVATSTTEAEYVAAASCCGQVLWIQNQMLDYGFNFMNTKIYIDNESTICIVKNPVYHSKTKHIAIRHHFIRDAYEKKLIQVLKIHTDDNVADLLTKAFDVSRFQFLVVSIGMINP